MPRLQILIHSGTPAPHPFRKRVIAVAAIVGIIAARPSVTGAARHRRT